MLTGIMRASVVNTSPRRRIRLRTSDLKLSIVVTIFLFRQGRPGRNGRAGRERLAKSDHAGRITVLAWTLQAIDFAVKHVRGEAAGPIVPTV